jgi:hypothetical protein
MATTQYIRYPGSGSTGVTSLNGLTGGLTLVAGTGISITSSGSSLTIANTEAGGSVTSVSVVSANGFAGTVANPTTTPAITLETTVTGILYGNGTSVAAAIPSNFPTLNQNTTGTASNITATSNSTLTTLSALSLPGSQVTGNISGDAANITATSNSTLVTLSSLSLPYSQVTGAPAAITALTGDVTATGPGSAVATLATVNASPGTYTNATVTVNGKGLVTSASTGTAPVTSVTASSPLSSSGGSTPNITITSPLPIANGGTNASTAATAFTNLSPLTTEGDIIYENATPAPARLPIGTTGQVLTVASGLPSWVTPTTGVLPGTEANENATINPSVATNNLTIALNTLSGVTPSAGSPCTFAFKSSTGGTTSTVYYTQSAIAATSITLHQNSSLGILDNATHYVYVYAIYTTAGGVELAVSALQQDEGLLYNTTAEGGGTGTAITNYMLYSTTARSQASIKLLGRVAIVYNVGTGWTNGPSYISCVPFQHQPIISRIQYNSSSQTAPASTPVAVDFDTTTFDTIDMWQPGSFYWIAPLTGFYDVEAVIELNTITTGQAQALVYVNGSLYSSLGNGPSGIPNQIGGSDNIFLNVTDQVQIYVLQTSASGVSISPSGGAYTHAVLRYIGT